MKPAFAFCCRVFFALLVLIAGNLDTSGQTFSFTARDENKMMTALELKQHAGADTIIVRQGKWDEMVSSGSSWAANLKFKSVHAFVRFSVDHRYPLKVTTPYTFRLTYKIYGYGNMADTNAFTTIQDTLTISYKPDSLSSFQDIQYKKYSNFHKIMIVVGDMYEINGAGSTPVLVDMSPNGGFSRLNFNVEGAIQVQPYNKKAKNGSAYDAVYGGTPPFKIESLAPVNDYMPVRWQLSNNSFAQILQLTPANYELEWTYVDDYKVNPSTGAVTSVPATSLPYDFKENSTRVWLDTNYYQIPMIYQKGYLVYRMRVVRPDSVLYQYPVYSEWTLAETGTVSSAGTANYRQITNAHLNDSLNWQYTVSFAEKGKYKQVMSYYDGMLKNRQSITRFNSMPGKLIATEQVYDYEGRPSISVLPTPVSSPSFRYQYNLTLNSYSGLPYRARDFDSLQLSVCPLDVLLPPLGGASAANVYYSPANPDQAGFQKFVPDAGGYPFVQTIYSPGYDERVEKQGGAGDSLQIGYKHNVKNDYVSADQMDLNRLFGLNIGWSGFYRKTVSRDPNGQLSLNITDYKGKTITSSMIGLPDTMKHAIVSNENLPDTAFYQEDHIAGTAQQILGNKRILDKNFFNDAGGNNLAQYVYNFTPFQTFCPGKYLSVKSRFDYSIFDECGTLVLDTGGTLGVTGVLTSGALTSYTSPQIPFFMEKGKHSLHKELTVNTDEVNKAIDDFMALAPAQNCMKTEPWFIKQSVLSKQFPCPEDFINMDCGTCEGKKYQMMQELWPNKDSVYMVRKYGIYHRVNDSVIGNSNSIFTPIIVSVPSGDPEIPPTIISRKYRYQDTCLVHLPASVTRFGHTYTNLQSLPVDTFIYIFNDSIAEALLPLHPEYCSLLECVDEKFKDKLLSIPNAPVANQLGLLHLSDIIAADPLYAQMQTMPAQYPNPFDTLAYTISGGFSLDTMALLQAYCGCQDSIMFAECYNNMFGAQIGGGIILNDYVKERYFEMIRSLYIGNRARYLFNLNPAASGLGGCSTCQPVRMQLVPMPVFVNAVNPDGSLATGPGSFLGTAQVIDPSAGATINDYFNLLQTVDLDTLEAYNDSAYTIYTNTNTTLCEGPLDQIIDQLVNCADSVTLVGVRNYLLQLCTTGQVTAGNYSPQQIRAALVSNGISLGDLCNPYLVNYDNNMSWSQAGQGSFSCNSDAFYTDATNTLNSGAVLNTLKNIGTSGSVSLNPANQFEQGLISALGGTSCTVSATYSAALHLYTLLFTSGANTAKVFFKTAASGTCSNAFTEGSGETVSLAIDCINNAPMGALGSIAYGYGYVGNFSFAATVSHTNGSNVTKCLLPGWTDKVEMNNTGQNTIGKCVPCTQMRSLYKDFQDTLTAYQVKGTDHPYYRTMLRNFMNYKLRKPYAEDQYLDVIESCALSDSMLIRKYISYADFTFGSLATMNNFVTGLNSLDPTVVLNPLLIADGAYFEADIDINGVPKNKLKMVKDFLSQYPTTYTANINHPSVESQGPTSVGSLFIHSNSSFYPDGSIFGGNPNAFTFYLHGTFNVWNGTAYEPTRIYRVNTPDINKPADINRNADLLVKYIYDNGINAVYKPSVQVTINDEYYLPEKQAYLNYTYKSQDRPSNKVLDTLQTWFLAQNMSLFSNKIMGYGNVSHPGNIQNLYFGDPMEMAFSAQYAKLDYIMTKVRNYLPGNAIFFTGSNTRNIPVPAGEQLTAYRCGDTAFWYRYFGPGDTLYDAFIRVPAYIDTNLFPGYQFFGLHMSLGNGDCRSFSISLRNLNAPVRNITLQGYTDFVVSKNKVLKNVLLAHPVNEPVPMADTVNNCERQLLNAAIFEGKIKYKMYVDSIRERLSSDFYAYIMNGGIQEKLFVGYRNQRFNYTLYYYDRAGNLVRTVPPAGTAMLPNNNLPDVDAGRTSGSTSSSLLPAHHKPSDYLYNTLNQVEYQKTPDGNQVRYFYDAAGRVIFSQNDKQAPLGNMTYTLYDKQGRIMETGESKIGCPYFPPYEGSATDVYPCYYYDAANGMITPYPDIVSQLKTLPHEAVVSYVRSLSRSEVVLTRYDKESMNLGSVSGMSRQDNLRKRVAAIKYFDYLQPADTAFQNFNYAMHFSYDIAGNVKVLTRDYPQWKPFGQEYKRIDYDYDVISGKVNLLSYNRGFADQFFQRYGYDADNRITKVETSSDAFIWKRDAEYQYYQHGPLARVSLGDLRVQGIDYAYTIQGWLKAVNGDQLDTAKDMGADAAGASVSAKDAVALSLDYFKGDYRPIGSQAVTHTAQPLKSMYNGNIPRASTAILPFPDLSTQYTYDQLNRIIKADYANMNRTTAQLTNTADYYSSYGYDADGNLKKLVRNGNKPATQRMDSLAYRYINNAFADNKLQNVNDYAANNYDNDLKQHTTAGISRYLYDATGNVIKDLVSGQDTIQWNHYNKVAATRNDSLGSGLAFAYDGAGNRYLKSVTRHIGDTTLVKSDYYVRDAQGNTLAVYNEEHKNVMTLEQWVEYITTQYCIPCTHDVYIDKLVSPYYGQNGYFKSAALQYALADGNWTQNQLNLSPVSYYMTHNDAVKRNMLNAGTFYIPLASYSAGNGTAILGNGLNTLVEDPNENSELLSNLLNRSNEMRTDVFGMLCANAPALLQQAMINYGMEPQQNCEANVQVLKDNFNRPGNDIVSFMEYIDQAGSTSYATSYLDYLRSLYSAGLESAGGNTTAFALMCRDAQGPMIAAMAARGLPRSGNCPFDVNVLTSTYANNPTSALLAFINAFNDAGNQPEFKDAKANYLRNLALNTTTSNLDGIQQHVLSVLCANAGPLVADIMEEQYIPPGGDCQQTADTLIRYFEDPSALKTFLEKINERYRQPAYAAGYQAFIRALTEDNMVMAYPYYTATGGALIPSFRKALINYGNETLIGNFMDQWQPAGTLLQQTNRLDALLAVRYDADPAGFLKAFVNDHGGDKAILVKGLSAIPTLTVQEFTGNMLHADLYGPCTVTNIQEIVHNTYAEAVKYQRINLAEHHLYGSSRLGTKSYLKGQYYLLWDNEGPSLVTDTLQLSGRRPWYSLEYNDGISPLATQPWGMADNGTYALQHQVGRKQYELTNHLGNVQATISDLPAFNTGSTDVNSANIDTIRQRNPAIVAAYDYYPFGMLMPGRYVSDTSAQCMTVTQTKWVTNMVDTCITLSVQVWYNTLDGSIIQPTGNPCPEYYVPVGGGMYTTTGAVPQMNNQLVLTVGDNGCMDPHMIAVEEQINGAWITLTSARIERAGDVKLNYTPLSNIVRLTLWKPGNPVCAKGFVICKMCKTTPGMTQQTILVDICDDDKDRYRFGFNGQEKVNEWAGIGNFDDFRYRGYDSRIGRFLSKDPLASTYPWYSPYQFAGNTPIQAIDLEGLEPLNRTINSVIVYGNGKRVEVVSEATVRIQVINISSIATDQLDLGVAKGIVKSNFIDALYGSYTATINQAFAWDSKRNAPSKKPGSYSQVVTYTTKVNLQWEVITSASQMAKDALIIGIVDKIKNNGDAVGNSDNSLGIALVEANLLANGKVHTKGGKAIVHELGHLFGLGDEYSNANNAMSDLGSRGMNFRADQIVQMLRQGVGNWDYLWNKKESGKPLKIKDYDEKRKIQIDFGTYRQTYSQ